MEFLESFNFIDKEPKNSGLRYLRINAWDIRYSKPLNSSRYIFSQRTAKERLVLLAYDRVAVILLRLKT